MIRSLSSQDKRPQDGRAQDPRSPQDDRRRENGRSGKKLERGGAVLVFVLIAGLALWQSRSLQDEQTRRLASRTREMAHEIQRRIEEHIETGRRAVEHLADEWTREHSGRPESFRRESASLIKDSPGFAALYWSDAQGVIRYVAPTVGNEQLEGTRLLELPGPARGLRRASESGAIAATDMRELRSGVFGFSLLLPVRGDAPKWNGFIGADFHATALLDHVLADFDLRTHFNFWLRSGREAVPFYAHPAALPATQRAGRVSLPIRVADRRWTLEIEASPLLVEQVDTRADQILLLGGVALAGLVAALGTLLLLRQRHLIDSEERYRDLFDNAPIPLWEEDFSAVLDFTEELQRRGVTDLRAHFAEHPEDLMECMRRVQILNLNQAALDLHGAQSKPELRAGLDRIFTEKSLEVFQEEIVALSAGGEHFESEAVVRTLDGEERAIRLWLRTGRRRGRAHFSNIDVTESNRARDELLRLQAAIDQSSDGIVISDERGIVTYVNDVHCQRVGLERSEILGRSFRHMTERSGMVELYDTPMDVVARQGRSWTRRYTLQGPDGSLLHREIHAAPVRDTTGRIVSMVAVIRDITRERQLEIQMEHSQKLESLGVLAGGIAHDFNNLLVSMLGNADLALHEMSPTAPGREHLGDLVASAQRAADLCRQLLAYSGKGHFLIKPVDLSEVVREMEHLLTISVSKNAELQYDLRAELPAVEADATQLRQVVLNLVANASDAIGEANGQICISTGTRHCSRDDFRATYTSPDLPEGVYVFVEIRDSGCGMSEQTRARIFDPFFTSKFAGHGLGLAAVLGIVRGHSGAIEVETEPGVGSTFRLLLPSSEHAVVAAVAERQPDGAWRAGGTVLVVDDETTVRELASKILRRAGFEVLTAADGRAGVALMRQESQQIDLVLLDLTMPHMGGEEAFREMRRISPDVPIIVSSGYSERDATETFSQGGLAGFVQKPYTVTELLRKIREALASRG